INRHMTSQNRVDQMMANLQNPADFAEPLLNAALKTRFGLELDVRKTFLRLYIPAHIPWLRLKSGAARIWTVSLLDALLHNFESAETEPDAFEPVSTYITPSSANGQFQTLPLVLEKMPSRHSPACAASWILASVIKSIWRTIWASATQWSRHCCNRKSMTARKPR
ncbi:MAG: dermonecrotic toxin domain-containing protein, partial [Pseudomonas sp.]